MERMKLFFLVLMIYLTCYFILVFAFKVPEISAVIAMVYTVIITVAYGFKVNGNLPF
jgi:hypothetical protein